MRINLQRFTLSTLTFSLATTLAVTGFSESASARNPGGNWGTSPNAPVLNFDVFLVNEDGSDIEEKDEFKPNTNLGVFENAIEIINTPDSDPQILTQLFDGDSENAGLVNGAVISENADIFDGSLNGRAVANLSAELIGNEITYQIYQGDYDRPTQFLKFAPVDISSRQDDKDNLVNNLEFILNDGQEGEYDVTALDAQPVGILGRAIDKSIKFLAEEPNSGVNGTLTIKKFAPPSPSTSIPEPTTTLASIFALGFAGKFLRKTKKNNA